MNQDLEIVRKGWIKHWSIHDLEFNTVKKRLNKLIFWKDLKFNLEVEIV